MSEPLRLSKRVVALTGCSRREAELYILGGWVTVAGQVVDEPQFMVLDQPVALLEGAVAEPVVPATLLLNRPADADSGHAARLMTPETRWADDASGIRTLRGQFARLIEPLPLEPGASGLAVYTQDWRVRRKLEDEAGRIEQEFIVEVSGQAGPWGRRIPRGPENAKLSWQNETHLRVAIKGPRPGQIAELCRQAGLTPLEIRRIRIGRLPLARLPAGQWRHVAPNERF